MKFFYCFYLLVFGIILFPGSAFSANEMFRSVNSGNWNSTSTWEMSTNGGGVWFAATSVPHDTSGTTTVRSPNTVTVTVSTSSNQLVIDGGGTLTINSGVVLTTPNGTGNEVTVAPAGVVNGTGTVRTQGTGVGINLRGGSAFSAQLRVNTGTADVYDQSSPNDGFLFGNLLIDSGATVNGGPVSGYSLAMYGNVTNNGTLTTSSTGGELRMKGPSIINNGTIPVAGHFHFDSTTSISGSGTFNGANQWINSNGNVTLLSDVTIAPSANLTMQTGGVLNINGFVLTFSSGTFILNAGSTVNSPGTVRTQNNVAIYTGNSSLFNSDIKVNNGFLTSGTTGIDRIFGNVTVDNGASYNCGYTSGRTTAFYGSITNNGTIYTSSAGGVVKMMGPALINSGSISVTGTFNFDTTTTVSGSGVFNSANQNINANGNITLLSNVTFSPTAGLSVQTGGDLNLNGYVLTFNAGQFAAYSGTTVNSPGTFRTQGNVSVYPVNGSDFNANFNVNSGSSTGGNTGFGDIFYGNVTIDNGATMNCGWTSGRTTNFYGNITNNGTLTTSSTGGVVRIRGSLVANSNIFTPANLNFDTATSISGTGAFAPINAAINANGKVTLLSNATITPGAGLTMLTGAVLNPNGFVLTYNSGEFNLYPGTTVSSPGTVRTLNNVAIYTGNSSAFNADIKVNNGSLTSGTTSNDRIFGNVTIDSGTTYNCGWSSGRGTSFYGNVTNNGTLTATSTGGFIVMRGPSLINNGIVGLASQNFYFDSTTALSGTGSFTSTAIFYANSNVTAVSGHQFWDFIINSGGSFNITNRLIKVNGTPTPILKNGTLTTAGSTIEYNGTAAQNIVPTISYANLKINNSAGTFLINSTSVSDTVIMPLGKLNLNGFILTISPTGYLAETPGNVLYGTSGWVTTTRSINAPSSMNVGGLGAVLTSSANLGSTEIRRGHTVQTGAFLGTSIQRYFDITPANNTGLNATLRFKYDESEIGGSNENLLTLYSSTNSGTNWTSRGGIPDGSNNHITINNLNSFSRWTANSNYYTALIGIGIQGFYNAATNRMNQKDTVRVYLRNANAPYNIVDSAKNIIDSVLLSAQLVFPSITPGTYYIQLKHRNSLETWSKAGGETYAAYTTLIYDFTTSAANAYGSNQIQIDPSPLRFGIYSGDVDQNGVINLSDLLLTYNSASAFETGYKNTDLNGDNIVDLTDITICSNNSNNFVSKVIP